MNPDEKLIQSYVADRYFVSTILRDSSAMVNDPPRYYETMAWEWDATTCERGDMVIMQADNYERAAVNRHTGICRSLLRKIAKEPA